MSSNVNSAPPHVPMTPQQADEALLRVSFDEAPIGMSLTSLDGRWVRVNKALCDILGYSEAELLATTFLDITYPDDTARSVEQHRALLAGECTRFQYEKRYFHRNGSVVWTSVTVAALCTGDGPPNYLLGQIQDISERVLATEALRESELLLRAAQEIASIGSWAWDADRGQVSWSDELYCIYGQPPSSEITYDRFLSFIHDDDRERIVGELQYAARQGGQFTLDYRVVRPDGVVRELHCRARAILGTSGALARMLGSSQDVTERRAAEELQRRQSETLRAIVDHIPAMITYTDAGGRPMFANREWVRLTGWNVGDFKGNDLIANLYPDAAERKRVLDFMEESSGRLGDFRMRRRDGRVLETSWACVRLSDGSLVGVAQDVTEQRQLEEQLRHAQKMEAIGRLAGGVAHDFNNLLTVIQSYATFIVEELPKESTLHTDLAEILAASERATALTRQLLAFSRRQMLQPRLVDVNRKVTNVVGMLRRVIGEDITLHTELDPEVWPVLADPGQLEQVLLNLAVNARDAMPSGGTLTLRTVRLTIDAALARARSGLEEGEYVSVTVEDTGVGIPHELLSQIFEPFFTTKALGKGTGLGLATVYGIVRQTGGYVYVESTPGHGSRFTVLLPRSAERAEPTAPPESLPPRGSETILLVEDDRPVRVAVRRMLEGLGYRVHEASNGAEAIGQLESSRERTHLVLTDVVMPDIHGRTLAECVLDQYAEPRVLYMSGYTEDEILQRGLGESGMALLQKPFTLEALARAVRTALR
ncbi:MAG: Blue-light-activated protein [Gemmatimonadetes bacterium]|nr:Blue-light-activated protein [Gemmatimonadota bacterium]